MTWLKGPYFLGLPKLTRARLNAVPVVCNVVSADAVAGRRIDPDAIIEVVDLYISDRHICSSRQIYSIRKLSSGSLKRVAIAIDYYIPPVNPNRIVNVTCEGL